MKFVKHFIAFYGLLYKNFQLFALILHGGA